MEEPKLKEANFAEYCPKCKYKILAISGDPEIVRDNNWKENPKFFRDPDKAAKCHDCLNDPGNWDSRKPINFEEKE